MTTRLRARLSVSALETNAVLAVRRAGEHAVADLRRDAWGHGLAFVSSALAAAGVRAARVDESDRATVTAAGSTATDAAPTLDSELLLGLPGTGGSPVMSVSSVVVATKALRAGEGVSYGYTHRSVADTRVALVAGGYGQGIVRGVGNAVSVEVAGELRPIVGRVAMDVFVVDIGSSAVSAGDEVVLFGSGLVRDGLAAWTAATGFTAAEIVCAIGLHVPREVIA
ncbi:hypothetical protein LG299_13525 [Microbacterium lacus]|uniref:alanine racemase C-terminal domain-containing protein n=1 Tax=Microbacterium lacus TaxID=415217 RepID=UPI0038510265